MIRQSPELEFSDWLSPLAGAEEVSTIYVPVRMPTQNIAEQWHPFQRSKNVHMIHEIVRLSAENMFDRDELPIVWEWPDGPLKSGNITRRWFMHNWAKNVLHIKTKPRRDEATIIHILQVPDGRIAIHVHSRLPRLTDPDGVKMKWLVDGLVHMQFMRDDSQRYVYSVTQSQEKLLAVGELKKQGREHEALPWDD